MPLHKTNSFLGATTTTALAVLGGDITLDNGVLSITGCPNIVFKKIEKTTGFDATVAEILGVNTISNTGANSTYYEFNLTQFIQSLGGWVSQKFFHTSPAAGTTTTTVSNALRAQIRTSNFPVTVNADGNATVVITAVARNPFIRSTANTTSVTAVLTTTGVHSKGTFADLTEAGITGGASGRTYSQVTFTYGQASGESNGNAVSEINEHTLFVDSGDPEIVDFTTKMVETLNAFTPGGVVSNPEILSVNG